MHMPSKEPVLGSKIFGYSIPVTSIEFDFEQCFHNLFKIFTNKC